MDMQEELRFFGKLVHNGVVTKEQVEGLLAAMQESGRPLSELAVQKGLLEASQLDLLVRLGGEVVPTIPGYELIDVLGKGGTAVVVRALDKKAHREVAIKVLLESLSDEEPIRRSFVREAKLLMKLDHENVAKGYKVGTLQGRLLFFLEHVDGSSLQSLLRDGHKFSEDAGLFIILQAARALNYLSEQGVVHRDIKPDNILLTRENQVKLIDLGFATSAGTSGDDSETTVGTVAYISPEQARGQGDLDVRSDIYSLGATLYQLVVGDLPFGGDSNQDILAAQILESLSSEVLKSRKISPHMHYFIEKMMAKERDIRYQDPAELIADIEEQMRGKKSLQFNPGGEDDVDLLDKPFADVPPTAPPSQPRYPSLKRRKRR